MKDITSKSVTEIIKTTKDRNAPYNNRWSMKKSRLSTTNDDYRDLSLWKDLYSRVGLCFCFFWRIVSTKKNSLDIKAGLSWFLWNLFNNITHLENCNKREVSPDIILHKYPFFQMFLNILFFNRWITFIFSFIFD